MTGREAACALSCGSKRTRLVAEKVVVEQVPHP